MVLSITERRIIPSTQDNQFIRKNKSRKGMLSNFAGKHQSKVAAQGEVGCQSDR